MRAFSSMSANVEPLRPRHEVLPSKRSNTSTMILDFKNLRCTTLERQVSMLDKEPCISTPDSTQSLAAWLDSGSLTPFQQFQQKNLDIHVILYYICWFYKSFILFYLFIEEQFSNSGDPKFETIAELLAQCSGEGEIVTLNKSPCGKLELLLWHLLILLLLLYCKHMMVVKQYLSMLNTTTRSVKFGTYLCLWSVGEKFKLCHSCSTRFL